MNRNSLNLLFKQRNMIVEALNLVEFCSVLKPEMSLKDFQSLLREDLSRVDSKIAEASNA